MKNKQNTIILISILSIFASSCVGYDVQRYDEENQCWLPYEEIETEISYGRTCGGSVTYSKKDGHWWKFFSTCLPDGYSDRNPPEELLRSTNCE